MTPRRPNFLRDPVPSLRLSKESNVPALIFRSSWISWLETEAKTMIEVGAFEAKTHLSALLERVSQG